MSQQELLKKVIHVLDANNTQYMVTGSIVSSLQGEPRSTHDIDFVVAIQKSSAKQLVDKNYLKYWVEELQLGDLWKRLTLEAELP